MKLPCDCGEQAELKCDDNGGHDLRVWWVECDNCETRTEADFEDVNDAIDAWNYGAEEDEEEETTATVAELVRMLAQSREEFDDLRADNGRLINNHMILQQRYKELVAANEAKKKIAANLTPASKVADTLDQIAERERMQAQVEELRKKLDLAKKNLKSESEEVRKAYKEISYLRRDLAAHRGAFRGLDWALISLQTHVVENPTNSGFITAIIEQIIAKARAKDFPPNVVVNSSLHRLIEMLSPDGCSANDKLYREGIKLSTLGDEEGLKSWYGSIMDKFSMTTQIYQEAWNALGRPGETKGDYSRPPRT